MCTYKQNTDTHTAYIYPHSLLIIVLQVSFTLSLMENSSLTGNIIFLFPALYSSVAMNGINVPIKDCPLPRKMLSDIFFGCLVEHHMPPNLVIFKDYTHTHTHTHDQVLSAHSILLGTHFIS